MNTKILGTALAVSLALLGWSLYAQVTRPYHSGTVWEIQFVRVKPGMDSAYKEWLATDWKREQEAFKSRGLTLGYKVLETESHNAADFNMMLITEVKDLATLESNEQKADELAQQVIGSDEQQRQGYKTREALRDPLGTRIAREVVLSPQ
ncbi:MAG TPA: hypothetical protein VEK33_03655 [Terriglobales bacterium]|nr:hypothetical protein [Terriglobales bacterium]